MEVLGGLVGQVYSYEAAREMNVAREMNATIDNTTVCSPGMICISSGSICEVILPDKYDVQNRAFSIDFRLIKEIHLLIAIVDRGF